MATVSTPISKSAFADAAISALCVLLIYCAVHPAALFLGHPPFPTHLLNSYEPWRSEFPTASSAPVNWILFDEILEFYPWREYLRQSILTGTIPLWDSTAFCGYPFAGLFQNAILYPLDRLLDVVPFSFFPTFRGLLHVLIAAIGMAVYLSQFRMRRSIIILGAVAFSLGGFMTVWFGHPHMKTAAWLPFVLFGIDRTFEKTRFGAVGFALASTFCLISGHIETALHIATAAFLYVAVRHIHGRSFREVFSGLARLAAGGALAIAASMGMTLPFAEYLAHSSAYAARADGVVVQPFLDAILALTHLFPRLFGSNADGSYWFPGFNSAEINGGFIGVIPIALGIVALFRLHDRRFALTHGMIVLFCLTVVYGIPPVYQLITAIPGYKMSYNFRLVLPMAFSLIVLAARQLDQSLNEHRLRDPILAGVGLVGLLIITSVPLWIHTVRIAPGSQRTIHSSDVAAAVVPLLLLICIAAFPVIRRWQFIPIVLLGVTTGELLWCGRQFNRDIDPALLSVKPASVDFLRLDPPENLFRVLPLGFAYPPHLSSIYGFHDVRGNDALTPRNVEDFVAIAQPEIKNPSMLPALRMMRLEQPVSPIWDALNVKRVLLPAGHPADLVIPGLEIETLAGSTRIYRNPNAFNRAFAVSRWQPCNSFAEGVTTLRNHEIDLKNEALIMDADRRSEDSGSSAKVSIIDYSSHRVTIDATSDQPNLVILSDTFFPGWHVTVNGHPEHLHCVNLMMRGVFIAPGQSRIVMEYRPVSWRLGLFVSFAASGIMAGWICFAFRRSRVLPTST